MRRDGRLEPAAVLVRTGPSLLRFGHLQWLADHPDPARPRRCWADAMIAAMVPGLRDHPERHRRALDKVMRRSAHLIAQWQTLGFCHGVMNTDNASLIGLSLDHGPFAFMDRFRPHHVSNASDLEGRYAWEAQPQAGRWNARRLVEACRGLWPEAAQSAMAEAFDACYLDSYREAVMRRWRAKLGLRRSEPGDAGLLNAWLTLMARNRQDYTLAFRALSQVSAVRRSAPSSLHRTQRDPAAFERWLAAYLDRLDRDGRRGPDADLQRARDQDAVNPALVLRTHLLHDAIDQAEQGRLGAVKALWRALQRPYELLPGKTPYLQPPGDGQAQGLELSCAS